jgi:hypothetical protein
MEYLSKSPFLGERVILPKHSPGNILPVLNGGILSLEEDRLRFAILSFRLTIEPSI